MPLPAIRRRIDRLEGVFVVDRVASYPPLTMQEIEELVEQGALGQDWTEIETARVARQCPYIRGELMITTGLRGEVIIKRYPGLDTAEHLKVSSAQMHPDKPRCTQK